MDMDFTIPLSSSQNFTDLLSQQGINTPNINTPNIFSQPQSPLPETSKDAVVKHRWTIPEEKILICAWLHTSKDAIVGNEQGGGRFWDRVASFYASSRTVAGLPIREANTCKQKWCKINEMVSKFAGCMDAAERARKRPEDEVYLGSCLETAEK
ncbi:glutathione S-transferase T3-like [Eutrema salsugineum]|uniref:glutathione S-transferase T3-like n=1 Tax=Eutrema salsugineum TaxID=72664 RepID=UPI000CECEF67|nr:glutathione S-transferase T3-like [Eutrema salsugineum]